MNLFEVKFVIDGIEQDSNLKELIEACNGPLDTPVRYICDSCEMDNEVIIDENLDPDLSPLTYSNEKCNEYFDALISGEYEGESGISYSSEARQSIARALTNAIWEAPKGSMLDSIALEFEWIWDLDSVGSFAALYKSVAAAADYAFEAGVKISSCKITRGHAMKLRTSCSYISGSEEETTHIGIDPKGYFSKCKDDPSFHEKIKDSTIIYIPFDPSDAELGGSALAALLKSKGEKTPLVADPDYLIDCYEIVKEMIDDGIVLGGRAIGKGGLYVSLAKLAKSCGIGMSIDVEALQNASENEDIVSILFNEVPGVIIAISDEDYGYIDSQMVLQDVAYFPVGLANESCDIKIRHKTKYNVADLLLCLMNRDI